MKMVKNLTKVTMKYNPNFEVREDLNFTDDGNHFKGFEYKGLPITTLRADDRTYLCIRRDYLQNDFTYEDWKQTEEFNLEWEFNGVNEIDLDKLVENCEAILKKMDELNAKCRGEELDLTPLKKRLLVERDKVELALAEARCSVRWWKLKPYQLADAKGCYTALERNLEEICTTLKEVESYTCNRKRNLVQKVEKYGYAFVAENCYWIEKMKDFM